MGEVKCDCSDFKNGMPQIIDSQRLLFIIRGIGYTGKKIKFCPWCGKKLTREADRPGLMS